MRKSATSLAVLTGRVPGALNGQVPEKMAAVPSLPVSRIEADLLAARPDIAAQKALLEEKMAYRQNRPRQSFTRISS